LVDYPNNFFQCGIRDGHIYQTAGFSQLGDHLPYDRLACIETQLYTVTLFGYFDRFGSFDLEIPWNLFGVTYFHTFGCQVTPLERRHFILINNLPVVDHDHPPAKRLDIPGIVRGE
jgi:hypothetical protein